MIYLQLFLSFLQVGMFSFGGGYASMPLIQGQVVTGHHWLSMSEFRLREYRVRWRQHLDAFCPHVSS